jgi:hypothetical protein
LSGGYWFVLKVREMEKNINNHYYGLCQAMPVSAPSLRQAAQTGSMIVVVLEQTTS